MSKEKDISEKTLLKWNDVFADIINGFLCDGTSVVNQEDLTDSSPTSQFKVGSKLHEQERDVAKFWSKAGARIAILGVENQTKPDPDMAMRIIGYDGASYKEQALQHDAAKNDKEIQFIPPYPAITLVINYGKAPWNQPKSLLESIGKDNIPEELRPYFNDYKIFVFDIVSMSKNEIEKFKSDFKHVAQVVWALGNNAPYDPSSQPLVHADETLKTISALTGDDKFQNAYNNIIQNGSEGGISMCRITAEFEQRGEERGMKRGMERGMERGIDVAAAVVRSFRESGSVSQTASANSLSEEDTIAILKKFQMLPM